MVKKYHNQTVFRFHFSSYIINALDAAACALYHIDVYSSAIYKYTTQSTF